MNHERNVELTVDEERLLVSYLSGPRIWDAASLLPVVFRLDEKGLIEPHGDNGAYALTTPAGWDRAHALTWK